jgi:glycosyltransferase involved in cell wall biosynthesis
MAMISVIIPCLNAEGTIAQTLAALSRQDFDGSWEVVVADNGSEDETLAIVEQYRDRLPAMRVIHAQGRKGAGNARNAGAHAASGHFLAFCDADDEPDSHWLAAIAGMLARHVFVISNLEYNRLNTLRLRRLQRNPFRHAILRGKYQPFLPMVAASGLAVSKALHDRIGGFDDKVRYTEDCDYGWRLQLLGHHPIKAEDAILHVRFRETGSDLFRQAFSWGEYNSLLIKRYRPLGMPTIPKWHAFLAWLRLVRRLPSIGNEFHRDQWLWDVGYRLGEYKGWWRFDARDISLDPTQFRRAERKGTET